MAFLFDAVPKYAHFCPTCPNAHYPDNLGKWAEHCFIHAHSRYSRFEIVNGVNIVNVFEVFEVFEGVNRTNSTNRELVAFHILCILAS